MPFIVDNEFGRELSRNFVLMKRCRKISSAAFITSIIAGILMVCYSFVSMVGVSWDWIPVVIEQTEITPLSNIAFIMIVDTLIVCPLTVYLTYRTSMLHHDLAGMITIAIHAINMILLIFLESKGFIARVPVAFVGGMIYSVLSLVMSSANMWSVIKYHWLEQQRGFPHFSARFEEQKEDKFQRGIMDQYEQEVSRLKRTSTNEMTDIGQSNQQLDKYEHEHKPSTMDEI